MELLGYLRSFLTNQWVVGIITGLIASSIIILITFIRKKIGKKELQKKAQERCVELLLKYVDKNGIPNEQVVLSVITAIACQHHLDPKTIDVKMILNGILVKLIEQDKYSGKKSTKLLNDIEERIIGANFSSFDISDSLSNDQVLSTILNEALVLDYPLILKDIESATRIADILSHVVTAIIAMSVSFISNHVSFIVILLSATFVVIIAIIVTSLRDNKKK